MSYRTDLALEEKESSGELNLEGVSSEDLHFDGLNITRVKIMNEVGSRLLNKPQGNYITIEFDDISGDGDGLLKLIEKVSYELKTLCGLQDGDAVLIAGLGNEQITPDALGPKAAKKIIATRHIKDNLPTFSYNDIKFRDVAVISPGVLGQTGIETAEIIKGVVDRIQPKLVIVIDALMSRKMKRLAKTVQIADSGLIPGGGVGNARASITKEYLGVPVISLGVPTVVDAATLSCDVIDEVLMTVKNNVFSDINMIWDNFPDNEKYELIRQSLAPYDLNLIVTPKDIDFFISEISKVVGYTINKTMHEKITIEDIEALLS